MGYFSEVDRLSKNSMGINIKNEYLLWLGDLVDAENEERSYRHLLRHLYNIRFRYFVPNDSNRASDGFALRIRFSEETDFENYRDIMKGPCTVLEMLVALAIRCEDDIMHDEEFGDRTSTWFWEFCDNLGLKSYTDDEYFDLPTWELDHKIDVFLDRLGQKSGKGGIFPRKSVTKDQRKIEIWDQMCGYFDEKYFKKG